VDALVAELHRARVDAARTATWRALVEGPDAFLEWA
jgi:hypothetical protein